MYETASGLWRGRFVVTDPVTRRKVRRYVSGHTRAEANRELRAAMAAAAKETAAGDSPTLAWWAARWLDTSAHRIRPPTLRSYRQTMRVHVLPALGSWPLAELRPGDVERWTGDLADRLAPSTVALSRRVLAACLADAERDGRIARNAARLAHAPKVEGTTRRRALTATEARHLLDLARDDPRAGLLVIVALGTGLVSGSCSPSTGPISTSRRRRSPSAAVAARRASGRPRAPAVGGS